MEEIAVRQAGLGDLSEVAEMCHCLWPDVDAAEHEQDLTPLLGSQCLGAFPAVVLLAQDTKGRIVGFIEVGLRSHADGCDPSRPVGFIEGWYVAPAHLRRRIGTRLVSAAEAWARNQGCTEMASDTWLDAFNSQRAHEALGFEVVDRCIHYRKQL